MLFRRIVLFALLLVVLSLVAVRPALAQDDQTELLPVTKFFLQLILKDASPAGVPIVSAAADEMLEHAVSPDQTCNPACISIVVDVTCWSGATPPIESNQQYWADVKTYEPLSIGGTYLPYMGTSGRWRYYYKVLGGQSLNTYYVRYLPTTGPWAGQPSNWQSQATPIGGTAYFHWWRYRGDC